MGMGRVAGLVMLVAGVVLLIMGINASNSLGEQAYEAFTGHFTKSTTWYILGGVVLTAVGGILTAVGVKERA